MDTLPVRLRMLRKGARLTLRTLSERSGVSISFLSDMERGERGVMPSLETLEAIAGVYGLTIGEALVNVRIRPEDEDGRLTAEQSKNLMEELRWAAQKERELMD